MLVFQYSRSAPATVPLLFRLLILPHDMTQRTTPLRIAPQPDQPNLSKGQRAFNTLVKQIESSRQLLAQWQAVMLTYQQKVASDYQPLVHTFQQHQADMVRALDRAWNQRGLSKTERRVVQEIICRLAEHLIVDTGDDTIKDIYNKHSDIDFDSEEAAAVDSMKAAVEEMFDMEFGVDADLDSPEAILAQLHEQMEKENLRRQEEQGQRSQKKKTAKQRAREEKLKAEADETSLSIREVYRKLVSALHPDREPNAQERARKTALMQRVNQAYDKKDLLQLLELQLELEHIDARTIAGLSEDRLKHFNKILRDQLAELEQEIWHVENPLREQFRFSPNRSLAPDAVLPLLMRDIAEMRRRIQRLQEEILVPRDLATFKLWIKMRRRDIETLDA